MYEVRTVWVWKPDHKVNLPPSSVQVLEFSERAEALRVGRATMCAASCVQVEVTDPEGEVIAWYDVIKSGSTWNGAMD